MSEKTQYFVLNKELTVDDPDCHITIDMSKLEQPVTLKPGTRFKVCDSGYMTICGAKGGLPTDEQAAFIMPHLEPAEYKIGQALENTAEETLAALSELGIIDKDDMERANEFLMAESASQGDMKQLLYRNWIDWYPS